MLPEKNIVQHFGIEIFDSEHYTERHPKYYIIFEFSTKYFIVKEWPFHSVLLCLQDIMEKVFAILIGYCITVITIKELFKTCLYHVYYCIFYLSKNYRIHNFLVTSFDFILLWLNACILKRMHRNAFRGWLFIGLGHTNKMYSHISLTENLRTRKLSVIELCEQMLTAFFGA